MKCPAGYGEPQAPCNMEKAAVEFKLPTLKTSPLKGYVHFNFMAKTPLSPCLPTTTLSLNDNTRGVHNKENKEHKVSLNSDGLDESGYLSLENSHIEKEVEDHSGDEDHSSEEQLLVTTGQEERKPYALSTSSASNQCVSSLPILKFQRAVCQELAENFKRTQSYDWTVVHKLAEDYSLDRVIGRQMGLECVDVFAALLERDMKHILTRILSLLGDVDLINCRRVSRTWRRIISQDTSAIHRCQQAEQRLWDSRTSQKENMVLTRNAQRVVLSCLQTVASTSAQKASSKRTLSQQTPSQRTPSQRCCHQTTSTPQPTRFRDYHEVARTLKVDESLKRCTRCGSPAKYNAHVLRATCTRESCAFDFCTCCQSPFHGALPCRTGQLHMTLTSTPKNQYLPGSARSKRNVRRL